MSLRELIEFLTSNPFFIIIIIGIISSLFKKGNREQKHPTPPVFKQPINQERELDTPNRPRESRRVSPNAHSQVEVERSEQAPPLIQFEDYYAKKRESATNKISELKAEEEKLIQRANQYKGLTKERSTKQQEVRSERKLSVEQEEVLNGVIWSEILGAPRSKQPYSNRR